MPAVERVSTGAPTAKDVARILPPFQTRFSGIVLMLLLVYSERPAESQHSRKEVVPRSVSEWVTAILEDHATSKMANALRSASSAQPYSALAGYMAGFDFSAIAPFHLCLGTKMPRRIAHFRGED